MAMTGEAQFAERDLSDAVAAGIIDAATADRLAAFLAQREAPTSSEDEQLRLVSGFGDIFVAIGLVLFLGALFFLTLDASLVMPAVATALASWGLAELFTGIRRQALPSILLLLTFAGSVFLVAVKLIDGSGSVALSAGFGDAAALAGGGLITCLAVALHWWRFHVPITIAAACAAAAAALLGVISIANPGIMTAFSGLIFLPLGLAIFALAMRFDSSDRERRTRRTDMAFWLHALAAPMVVHPVMQNITHGTGSGGAAVLLTFAAFLLLGLVALTVDRRAMLVSSLIYLGYAIYTVLRAGNALPTTSLAVLLVGAVVLGLSFAWRPLRAALLARLPASITLRVPPSHLAASKSG
ncbi:MAG: hypothetical protein U1E15_01915 [Hyphomicrobiales bacterium]